MSCASIIQFFFVLFFFTTKILILVQCFLHIRNKNLLFTRNLNSLFTFSIKNLGQVIIIIIILGEINTFIQQGCIKLIKR